MDDVTIHLTDENAIANYPFLFKVGDRVRSRTDGREGAVENATFVGPPPSAGGAFQITYEVRVDDIGVMRYAMADLEKPKTNSA
ncbi:MAG TPA: hypothetical protein VE863_20275 [Pyrinomonadaceae bacterium]|jgi:hypothetical protein|nr:hypothetical protein [Pyrinomonadaceae bacterium]